MTRSIFAPGIARITLANMQQRVQLPRDYDEDEFIVCLRADWSEYT